MCACGAPRAQDSVIVRTRFDVVFDHYFDLAPLRALLEKGAARGRALALSQESAVSQGDLLFVAPRFATYAEHVARPLDGSREAGAAAAAGADNGWGYGRHVRPSRPPCPASAAGAWGAVDDGVPSTSQCAGSSCDGCALTVVEDYVLPFDAIVRGNVSSVLPPPTREHRLGEHVRLYCPLSVAHDARRFAVVNKSWLPPFLRAQNASRSSHVRWPPGC